MWFWIILLIVLVMAAFAFAECGGKHDLSQRGKGHPTTLDDLPDGHYRVKSSNQVGGSQIVVLDEYFFNRGIFVIEICLNGAKKFKVGYGFSKWLGKLSL